MSVSFWQTSTPTERVSFYDSETVCGRGTEQESLRVEESLCLQGCWYVVGLLAVPLLRASGVWG